MNITKTFYVENNPISRKQSLFIEMEKKDSQQKIIYTQTTVSFPFTFKLDQIFRPENNVHQPHRQTIDYFIYMERHIHCDMNE